jgi:hypothetical protein
MQKRQILRLPACWRSSRNAAARLPQQSRLAERRLKAGEVGSSAKSAPCLAYLQPTLVSAIPAGGRARLATSNAPRGASPIDVSEEPPCGAPRGRAARVVEAAIAAIGGRAALNNDATVARGQLQGPGQPTHGRAYRVLSRRARQAQLGHGHGPWAARAHDRGVIGIETVGRLETGVAYLASGHASIGQALNRRFRSGPAIAGSTDGVEPGLQGAVRLKRRKDGRVRLGGRRTRESCERDPPKGMSHPAHSRTIPAALLMRQRFSRKAQAQPRSPAPSRPDSSG